MNEREGMREGEQERRIKRKKEGREEGEGRRKRERKGEGKGKGRERQTSCLVWSKIGSPESYEVSGCKKQMPTEKI